MTKFSDNYKDFYVPVWQNRSGTPLKIKIFFKTQTSAPPQHEKSTFPPLATTTKLSYINKDNINDKLKDGSHIVFVNCSYRGKDISDELKNFFNYIKTGKATGNDDNFAHRISEEVAINRENEEWEEAYMTFEEIVKIEYKKGIHQGKKDTLQYLRTLSLDELKSVLEKDNEEILELATESKNNY